jgi:hypothetical protein
MAIVGAKAHVLLSYGMYKLMEDCMHKVRRQNEESARRPAAEVMSGEGDLPIVEPGVLTEPPVKAQSGVPIEPVLISGESTQQQPEVQKMAVDVSPPPSPPPPKQKKKGDTIPYWPNLPPYYIASHPSDSESD